MIWSLRNSFGIHNRPSSATITKLFHKFNTTGSVLDFKRPICSRSCRPVANIAAVSASVYDNPSTSIPHRCQQLDLSYSTTQRILKKICICMPIRFYWPRIWRFRIIKSVLIPLIGEQSERWQFCKENHIHRWFSSFSSK